MGFMKGKLKIQKRNSKSCNSGNYFPVYEQVIISTENWEIELFFLEKGNNPITKQTISGLIDFKTKFDWKMTGEKKKTNNS